MKSHDKRPTVFICRKIPQQAVNVISEFCDYEMWDDEDTPVPRSKLLASASHMDGILTLLTERVDFEFLESAKHLRIVSNMAVGYDNIDIQLAKARNVVVTNTPDVLTETTADLTFGLMLATARRIVEAALYIKENKWTTWSPMLLAGQDVHHKTLGIVGMGRIGAALAKRAHGFGMNVLYHNRTRRLDEEKKLSVHYRALDELLRESDFVCVLVPHTEETHHLIGQHELTLMKPTSVLINTSRGAVVDERALYDALHSQRIWGAGLDVFESEPIQAEHPLVQLPNVVALPHIGSASISTRTRMAVLAAENLVAGLTGGNPPNRVV